MLFHLLIFFSVCEEYRNSHKSKIRNYNILWVRCETITKTTIQLGFIKLQFVRERSRFTTVLNWKWNWSIRFVFGFIRFNPSRHTINVSLGTHLNNAHNMKCSCIESDECVYVCVWVSFLYSFDPYIFFSLLIHNLCISIARLYSQSQYKKWQERRKNSICCRDHDSSA